MENQSEIKRLPDGAIHFDYYQQKARIERSDIAYEGLTYMYKNIVKKIWDQMVTRQEKAYRARIYRQ